MSVIKPDKTGTKSYINLVISKSAAFHPVKQASVQHQNGGTRVVGTAGNASVGGGSDESTVRERLNKYANLYAHCLVAGTYVKKTYAELGGQMTDEQFQACVSALFINASKDGLQGLVATGMFSALPPATPAPHADEDQQATGTAPNAEVDGDFPY